jgi:MoxR-like ATPase
MKDITKHLIKSLKLLWSQQTAICQSIFFLILIFGFYTVKIESNLQKYEITAERDIRMKKTISTIRSCITQELNVMLYGYHGVGKTQMVLDEALHQGLKLKYYSSATLDPWADLVGIPVPEDKKNSEGHMCKQLQFVRPGDIERAQIIFFDELNRSHPKVQNAVLEAIQFHSINGEALPNLKMVWAAINPSDDIYQVSELDPVLVDRFHVHLEVAAEPSVSYYTEKTRIPHHVAKALVLWWHRDLDDNLRKMISPPPFRIHRHKLHKGN